MATLFRCPTFRSPTLSTVPLNSPRTPPSSPPPPFSVHFGRRSISQRWRGCVGSIAGLRDGLAWRRNRNFVALASSGEATETEEQVPVVEEAVQENSNGGADFEPADSSPSGVGKGADSPVSPIISSLLLHKEAVKNNEESTIAEVEALLRSIEDEKNSLEKKVASLTEELQVEKDRVLRISADFDNFRKRTERERLSLVTNAQGEVIEDLLPVLDNFERAKAQIKVETEGEEKITNSYQSIYKQFVEILASTGVVPVETVGKPFDPLLHEAIMREESSQFEEGVIIEEYRKGFKLGDRLLRPSMVKVSAGPGPGKPEASERSSAGEEEIPQTSEAGSDTAEAGDSNEPTAP